MLIQLQYDSFFLSKKMYIVNVLLHNLSRRVSLKVFDINRKKREVQHKTRVVKEIFFLTTSNHLESCLWCKWICKYSRERWSTGMMNEERGRKKRKRLLSSFVCLVQKSILRLVSFLLYLQWRWFEEKNLTTKLFSFLWSLSKNKMMMMDSCYRLTIQSGNSFEGKGTRKTGRD